VRLGRTASVRTQDAYGRLQFGRPIVALRGDVRSGNSGGPIVDGDGRVVATVFAQRRGSEDGFAVPNAQVQNALAEIGPALETSCVER
jgi:S1-C subfamily serine protease